MARPPLHTLQGFLAAARYGNLTRAADTLHITVSALSHQMRALEMHLGYRILERQPRGVRLTDDGRRLLLQLKPHLDAIDQLLSPFAARPDHVLTLSATPSFVSAWLVPRLGGFLAAHPEVEVSVLSESRVVDFERQPQTDAALRIGQGSWAGVHAEHLFDEWMLPVASPELVASRGGLPTPAQLRDWPLLGDPDDEWARWFAHFDLQPPTRWVAQFDDSEAQNRAARDGFGVALGRLSRARLLLDSGQLVALSDQRIRAGYAHYLVYPARSAERAGLMAFRDWVLAQARIDAAGARP